MTFTGNASSPVLREADRWSVTLPPQAAGTVLELQAEAVDDLGRRHRHPPLRPLRVFWREPRPLVLNEFLALNETGIEDPAGEREDWVELFSTGDEDVDLAGLFLSDDAEGLTQWAFPADLSPLPAGELLLVWADNDLEQPGLHAGFRLSGSGEALILSAADGVTILDSLSFGPQVDDVYMGRIPDGTGPWQPLAMPSPGAANDASGLHSAASGPTDFVMHAWPNPFNGGLRLQITGGAGPILVEIFNLSGQLL